MFPPSCIQFSASRTPNARGRALGASAHNLRPVRSHPALRKSDPNAQVSRSLLAKPAGVHDARLPSGPELNPDGAVVFSGVLISFTRFGGV